MTRKKTFTKDAVLLNALRINLSLLGELAVRYDVATRPEGPEDPPSIGCPEDVRKLLGPEMSGLAQEQLRVLLLNTKNLVVGQRGRLPGQRELLDDPAGRGAAPRRHGGRSQHHRLP